MSTEDQLSTAQIAVMYQNRLAETAILYGDNSPELERITEEFRREYRAALERDTLLYLSVFLSDFNPAE